MNFRLLLDTIKLLSFYPVYRAIVSIGFSEPYSILFRELKQNEEAESGDASSNSSKFLYEISNAALKMKTLKLKKPNPIAAP